jgi:hypothetical protein
MLAAEQDRGQVAAVAAAARGHPLGVDPGLGREPLGGLDRVGVGQFRLVGVDRVGEVLAEAARAVEVVPGRHVTPAGEDLRVPAEVEAVGNAVVRSAVQQQVQRVLLVRIEIRRVDHPHLDVAPLAPS